MLLSLNKVSGFKLQGSDYEVGECKDFLFDDQLWVIRYMVANTNKWLPGGRTVVISPISLGKPDWDKHYLPINLTCEEIENSPSLDEHQPISHQYEADLFKYYGYGYYWMGGGLWGTYARPTPLVDSGVLEDAVQVKTEDRHLRSVKKVKGYAIKASDKKIGHIDDFILNADNWTLPYIVVDTNSWLLVGGRKVLISHKNIEAVNWADQSVVVNISTQKIEASPTFDPELINDQEYMDVLNIHYGISQD